MGQMQPRAVPCAAASEARAPMTDLARTPDPSLRPAAAPRTHCPAAPAEHTPLRGCGSPTHTLQSSVLGRGVGTRDPLGRVRLGRSMVLSFPEHTSSDPPSRPGQGLCNIPLKGFRGLNNIQRPQSWLVSHTQGGSSSLWGGYWAACFALPISPAHPRSLNTCSQEPF